MGKNFIYFFFSVFGYGGFVCVCFISCIHGGYGYWLNVRAVGF